MGNVEVFAICYNEEYMLPFFIQHYKEKFNAKITIYDNYSTDKSKEIIEAAGCTYIPYDSGNEIRDDIYLQIKNNCWKDSKADWVIVCDIDEFLEVDFDVSDYTIIVSRGYDMVGFPNSRYGVPNSLYSKSVMFKPSEITEINYSIGCHSCLPKGNVKSSFEVAKLLHRKYILREYVFNKHLAYKKRLSKLNKDMEWGYEYQNVEKEKIDKKFEELIDNAILV